MMNSNYSLARPGLGRTSAALALASLLAACGGSGGGGNGSTPTDLLSGKTSFVSADRNTLGELNGNIYTATATSAVADKSTRSVEQGDIYRVLQNGKTIVNLNRYRGLQVLDISNNASPKMIGRVPMNGDPVEMYQTGTRMVVLLNGWNDYKRVIKDGKETLDHYYGGGVITVDMANPAAPKILASTRVPGYIATSRLTSGDGKQALYLASSQYTPIYATAAATSTDVSTLPYENKTSVHSYSVNTQGDLVEKSTIALGGYIQALQASGDRLMVARYNEQAPQSGSTVSVIDIASPDGVMVKGADVQVAGMVQSKTNMHVQGDVLRVVSGNWWNTLYRMNHVESFNIADIMHPVAVDHDTFGANEQLYASTFLADKAFFVTYLRTDPFHAFSITPQGMLTEESQFTVSGWNDFLKPVNNDSRLLGVGINDANGRRALSVSLYDVSKLTIANPLLARADMDLSYGWSEASWDDRAFTVLENATKATAADGKTAETGLILLPFSGWNTADQSYQSGVQVFTFSATTLTKRGMMTQENQVRRSVLGDSVNGIAANLSDVDLNLFDLHDVDHPAASGKLALAPNMSQFVAFRNIGARYHANEYNWWGGNATDKRTDTVELVSLADADGGAVAGHITVPVNSTIYNVAEKLVVISSRWDPVGIPPITTITTYDVSEPSKPKLLGTMTSNELLQQGNVFFADAMVMCTITGPCGRYYGTPDVKIIGNAMVFSTYKYQNTNGATPRYWSSFEFHVLDLSDASHPNLLPVMTTPSDQEAVMTVAAGNSLWINYRRPIANAADGQPQVQYFMKALDLSTPGAPKLGKEINIPGQLQKVDGNKVYTFDASWVDKKLDNNINQLVLQDDLAYLQASYSYGDKLPNSMLVDGSNVIVSTYVNGKYQMAVFRLPVKDFVLQSNMDLENYAVLREAKLGKVLVQSDGGLLMYNLSTPASPQIQAYFPAVTWSNNLSIHDSDIYLAGNNYGVAQFNFNTVNLAAP